MSVSPVIALLASQLDRDTARQVIELEQKHDWPAMLGLARIQLQRDPRGANWWFLQGYALGRQGQHAEASVSFERAVSLSPEDEMSWLALGQSLSELGQTERVIQTYRQALRYRPESAATYLALAEVYQKQGRQDLAIPNFRECVRYAPDSAQGWYGLALAYQLTRQGGRRDEALQSLRKLEPATAGQFEKQYPSK